MRIARVRPVIKIHAHYDGGKPFADAYADVFAMLIQTQKKAKSSVRTFDCHEPFQYDWHMNQKERDDLGTAS